MIEDVKASETTLTRLFGIGPLNAALILGDVGDVSRFPTRNHFASYTGTAPIAVSSGDRDRHRLSRSGNREALRCQATNQRRDLPAASSRSEARSNSGSELASLAIKTTCPATLQIARNAPSERQTQTSPNRLGLASVSGSGCGHSEASASRRKLITRADRKVTRRPHLPIPNPPLDREEPKSTRTHCPGRDVGL